MSSCHLVILPASIADINISIVVLFFFDEEKGEEREKGEKGERNTGEGAGRGREEQLHTKKRFVLEELYTSNGRDTT